MRCLAAVLEVNFDRQAVDIDAQRLRPAARPPFPTALSRQQEQRVRASRPPECWITVPVRGVLHPIHQRPRHSLRLSFSRPGSATSSAENPSAPIGHEGIEIGLPPPTIPLDRVFPLRKAAPIHKLPSFGRFMNKRG